MPTVEMQIQDLVIANHILANEGVVDGFGHVSIRHPERSDRFFLSCSRSPELVARGDIMEFDLDCNPIDQSGRTIYSERPIHGSMYKARPDVMAVIHNHAHDLLPFSLTDLKLRPLLHLSGPMGEEIPVWDISDRFGETDLLVRTMDQGNDLAACLGENSVALLRGHGAVVIGKSLRESVLRAVYVMLNAKIQMQVMHFGRPIKYLSPAEIVKTGKMATEPVSIDRAWEYWARRAEKPPGR